MRKYKGLMLLLIFFAVCLPAGMTARAAAPQFVVDPEMEAELANISLEEMFGYFDSIDAILSSEEFREMIMYPEVQDLILEVLKRGAEFAYTERGTTQEILRTAGVQERYIYLFMLLLTVGDDIEAKYGDHIREIVREFKESEPGQRILQFIDENLTREDVMNMLLETYGALRDGYRTVKDVYEQGVEMAAKTRDAAAEETGTVSEAETELY